MPRVASEPEAPSPALPDGLGALLGARIPEYQASSSGGLQRWHPPQGEQQEQEVALTIHSGCRDPLRL